jgi:hypothetical protein
VFFNRTKTWINETETPRWLLGIGFCVTLILSTGINAWFYHSERADESIDNLSSLSNDLNVLAGAFVSTLLDDPSNAATAKADLSAAIIRLHSEISTPMVTFDAEATVYAENAKVSLEQLSNIIAGVEGPKDLGAFWQTMAIFISSRNQILEHYRS